MSYKQASKDISFGGLWAIALVLLIALGGVGAWAFRVATSDIKGQGDAVVTKNSGTNRIAAQERFEDMYQDILAADRRIAVAAATAKRNPSQVNTTNLAGAVSYCIEVVADYNAEARKYTAQEFRSLDLPAQIFDPELPLLLRPLSGLLGDRDLAYCLRMWIRRSRALT